MRLSFINYRHLCFASTRRAKDFITREMPGAAQLRIAVNGDDSDDRGRIMMEFCRCIVLGVGLKRQAV